MKELDECLNIKRKIDEIENKINTLRMAVLSPRNQVITGMPKSVNNTESAMDRFLVKIEKLEQQKESLLNQQKEHWNVVISRAREARISGQEVKLLYIRFVKGYAWKKCSLALQQEYGNWNINKVFRTYRKILNVL